MVYNYDLGGGGGGRRGHIPHFITLDTCVRQYAVTATHYHSIVK